MICNKCNKVIQDSDNFCSQCGQVVRGEKPWNIIVCEKERLWNKDAFQEFPSIIAHEYHRIYKLIGDDKTYGAMMQIKDLLEVLIKFPVVVEMSRLKDKADKTEEEYSFLYSLLYKPLSLGDWRTALTSMSKHNEQIFEAEFMQDLKELYSRKDIFGTKSVDIVHWRNKTIGHGALAFDSDEKFKFEFESLLLLIADHLNKWNNLYINMDVYSENGFVFKGKDKAADLEQNNSELFFKNNDGIKLSLYPFLLLLNNQFYIFDALVYNKNKYDVLSYPIGHKHEFKDNKHQQDIVNLFEEADSFIKRDKFLNKSATTISSAEDSAFLISYDDYLNRNNKKIYAMSMLDNWLKQGLGQSENKIFLLMMERGMGKTTWVNRISTGKGFSSNIIFKTIYLNDTYHSNWDSIISKIDQSIKTDRDNTIVFHDSKNKHIRMEATNIKAEMADFFKYYTDLYKKEQTGNKIVLILDGIDEIKLDNTNNILDWIPTPDMLPDDFYILLTCRNSEEISGFLNICLDGLKIPEQNKLVVYREDENYRQVLETYIKKYTDGSDIVKILEKSDYRFAYVNLLTTVIKHSSQENKQLALAEGEIIEDFLRIIETYYDKRHLIYFYNVIYIIATAPEAITIKELSYLLGEEKISFKLLGFLSDLEGILKYERSNQKNKLSISNEIYRSRIVKVLMEKQPFLQQEIEEKTTALLSDIYTEFVSRDRKIMGEGQEFLLLHLNEYYIQAMDKYMDFNLFTHMLDCATGYINLFSYDERKHGYDLLEGIDRLYAMAPLSGEDEEWLRVFLKRHIHLTCQYQLLYKRNDLYVSDNIGERLRGVMRQIALQLDGIKNLPDVKKDYKTMIFFIMQETMGIEVNILVEYGRYYYGEEEYKKAKKMFLLAKDKMNALIHVGLGRNETGYRYLMNYISETCTELGEIEEASRYYKQYCDLLIDDHDLEENNAKRNYEVRSMKLNEAFMKVDNLEEKRQLIDDEIKELEDRIITLDRASDEHYEICKAESRILRMQVKEIGDEYLNTFNYVELLEFSKKMSDLANKIESRNVMVLTTIKASLCNYRVDCTMELGDYDDAFIALNQLKKLLDEIDNLNDCFETPDTNTIYLKTMIEMYLCKYYAIRKRDYSKAFECLLKAADIYDQRISSSQIDDTQHMDFVKHLDFLQHILGLYVTIDINAREGNEGIMEGLEYLFNRYDPYFAQGIKLYSWKYQYVKFDRINDKFVSCANGAYPKKFKLSGGCYELDFKKVCNRCSYKDCVGYVESGVFKVKK